MARAAKVIKGKGGALHPWAEQVLYMLHGDYHSAEPALHPTAGKYNLMDPSIETLLQIQDKDIRIANLVKQIQTVPVEKKQIQTEMTNAESMMDEAKKAIMDVEKRIKTIEMEIATVDQRKVSLQSKSSQIKKNDEYRAMLNEVAAFDAKIEKLEDLQLQEMEALEQARQKRAAAQKLCDAAQKRLLGTIEDLDLRARNCEEQVKKVKAERDEMAKAVEPELMRLYSRLTRKGTDDGNFRRGIAPLVDNNCGGCFLTVTPQVRHSVNKGDIVTCENCGVILYAAD